MVLFRSHILNGDRCVAAGGGAVAELAVIIDAPTTGRSIGKDGTCVVGSCGDDLRVGEAADNHGNVAVGVGAVAELAIGVVSPTACCPVAKESARVVRARVDLACVGEAADNHGDVAVGVGAVAELAVAVVSPTACRGVVEGGACGEATCRDTVVGA